MARPVIVLVAGNPGYELYQPILGGLTTRRLWIQPEILLLGGFGYLQLDTEGEGPAPNAGPALIPGVPHPGYYQTLMSFFVQKGWNTRYPKLDFRKKLADIGPALSDFLISLKSEWPLRIICHSAGGLYLRWALKWLVQQHDPSEVIYKIAGLTCAHWGTWHTMGTLAGYLGFPGAAVNLANTPAAWFTRKYPVDVIRDVVQSMPNIFQLLPNSTAPGLDQETATKIYTPSTWADAQVPLPTKWLDYAKSEWGTIATTWTGPPWLSIICGGIPTYNGISDWSKLGTLDGFTTTDDGDGVLISAWQTITGMEESRYLGLDHNSVCQNVTIARRVYAHLV